MLHASISSLTQTYFALYPLENQNTIRCNSSLTLILWRNTSCRWYRIDNVLYRLAREPETNWGLSSPLPWLRCATLSHLAALIWPQRCANAVRSAVLLYWCLALLSLSGDRLLVALSQHSLPSALILHACVEYRVLLSLSLALFAVTVLLEVCLILS